MKAVIDIPDKHLPQIERVCKAMAISRMEFIRRAMSLLLAQYDAAMANDNVPLRKHPAVGLLKGKVPQGNSLGYLEQLRKEWSDHEMELKKPVLRARKKNP